MRAVTKVWKLAALFCCLAGCSGESSAQRADYMLQWYPRPGTDYGDLVPGFKTLAMCRHAGSGKTLADLTKRDQINWFADGPAAKSNDQPWFECQTGCRPHTDGSYLLVCEEIVSFRGSDALRPF